MSTVSDLVIQGRFDTEYSPRLSDVFLYAKVNAQSSTSISIIHQQNQIRGTALLRVTPLNPDGSAPRNSPGISALQIPITRRSRKPWHRSSKTTTKVPKEIRFEDGKPIEGIAGDWSFSPSTPTLPILTGQGAFPESPYQDSALSRVFAPQQIAPFDGAAVHSVDDTDSHSDKHFAHKDRSFSDHFVTADSQITDESSDEDYEARSMAELENDEKYKERKPREIQVKQELIELQNTISSQLDSARKTMIPAKTKVQTAKIGTQSSGYFQQIIPCLQTASGSDVQRFEDPSLDIIEDIEKQPFGSGLTDGTGEMLLKSIMNRAGSGKWKDQVYLTVKDEEVFVCFPEKLQAQVYVIEVYLRIPPITLDYSDTVFAFVLAGLPKCPRLATLEFLVTGSLASKWQIDASHGNAPFDILGHSDGRGIFGKVDLDSDIQIKRSLVIRILLLPSAVEIYDHKIGSFTDLEIKQDPQSGYVVKVLISVSFHDVHVVPAVSRNLLNIILINCGYLKKEDINVFNDNGETEAFSLDGPIIRDGKELEGAVLLQIARRPEDVTRHRLWVSYDRPLETSALRFPMPVAEIGGPEDITEQLIKVHTEMDALKLRCTMNQSSWASRSKSDGSYHLRRLINSAPVEYPSLSVEPMKEVDRQSSALAVLIMNYGKSDESDAKIIDKLKLNFQEQEPWTSLATVPLKLCMSFNINISKLRGSRVLLRASCGEFHFDFITVDSEPLVNGLFMDGGDLVVPNIYRKQTAIEKQCSISIYWTARQGLEISRPGGRRYYELLIPQIADSLTMRVDSTFHTHRDARLVSRSHSPRSQAWSVPYILGKATLSGVQTFQANLHIQLAIGQKNLSTLKLLKALIDVEEARMNKVGAPKNSPRDIDEATLNSYHTGTSCELNDPDRETPSSLDGPHARNRMPGVRRSEADGAQSESDDTVEPHTAAFDGGNDALIVPVPSDARSQQVKLMLVVQSLVCIACLAIAGYYASHDVVERRALVVHDTVVPETLSTAHEHDYIDELKPYQRSMEEGTEDN